MGRIGAAIFLHAKPHEFKSKHHHAVFHQPFARVSSKPMACQSPVWDRLSPPAAGCTFGVFSVTTLLLAHPSFTAWDRSGTLHFLPATN